MALSERELRLIEEGIRLAAAAVLAAVQATKDDAPLDWSKLRITETPEMALEEAKQRKAEEGEIRDSRLPSPGFGTGGTREESAQAGGLHYREQAGSPALPADIERTT